MTDTGMIDPVGGQGNRELFVIGALVGLVALVGFIMFGGI